MLNGDDGWEFNDHGRVVNRGNINGERLTPRVACWVGDRDANDRLTTGLREQSKTDVAFGKVNGDHRIVAVGEGDAEVFVGGSVVAASAQERQNDAAVVFTEELITHALTGRVLVVLDGVASGDIDLRQFQCRVAFGAVGVPGKPSTNAHRQRGAARLQVAANGPFVAEGSQGHGFVGDKFVVDEDQPS